MQLIRNIGVTAFFAAQAASAQVHSTRVSVGYARQPGLAVLLGEELRGDIGSPSVTTGSHGESVEVPPDWMWNVAAHGGLAYSRGSGIQGIAQLKAGPVYHMNSDARVGVLAIALLENHATGLGAAVHYEPLRALAVELGGIHDRSSSVNNVFVGVDVALAFITDLVRGGSAKP